MFQLFSYLTKATDLIQANVRIDINFREILAVHYDAHQRSVQAVLALPTYPSSVPLSDSSPDRLRCLTCSQHKLSVLREEKRAMEEQLSRSRHRREPADAASDRAQASVSLRSRSLSPAQGTYVRREPSPFGVCPESRRLSGCVGELRHTLSQR